MTVETHVFLWLFCFISCGLGSPEGDPSREVLLVIACPPYPRHAQAECFSLLENIQVQHLQMEQAGTVPGDYVLNVHVMHELFNYWTVLDALPHLGGQTRLIKAHTEWIIWCQYNTHVASLRGLLEQLRRQNPAELAYYGHALYDTEATIVHHFAHYKNPQWFPYPMLRAGIIFTGVLLRRLVELTVPNARNSSRPSEFSIDASHELARFIFDNLSQDPRHGAAMSGKIILKNAAYICPTAGARKSSEIVTRVAPPPPCAMHAASEEPSGWLPSTLGHRKERCFHTTGSHIYFAIKTCAKFHKERIPIVERTWAGDARNRRYYSDVADVSIPTISTGIPNVQTGHCAKTMAILQLSLKDIGQQMDIRWLMLVDDDTLLRWVSRINPLSVPRLSELLSYHDHRELMYLGQRYGYRLHAPDGFNYHTGGAGILLSLPLVRLVVERCSCPSDNAPDDMILGYCLQALGVAAVPVAGMHQARPQDYARELLQLQPPVSFHKFWNMEPEQTYRQWLRGGSSGGNISVPLGEAKPRLHPDDAAQLHLPGGGEVYPLDSHDKHLDL
ncbi:hypothetical protein KR067_003516 [Drosophila pandora]|nr:hypothetical protein KR067_003516 [Drosophila pandora]